MRVELNVVNTTTVSDLAQIVKIANQETALSKGAELLAAIHAEKQDRSSEWDYGAGKTHIVFMDNRRVRYTEYAGRVDDWATAALFGAWEWCASSKRPGTPKQIEAEAAYCWIEPVQPRDVEHIAEHLEDADGFFCREVHNGIQTDEMHYIAANFARVLKRPVGWFYEGNIPLQQVHARYTRDPFEGLPVTFFDGGQRLEDAVLQFAKSLKARQSSVSRNVSNNART